MKKLMIGFGALLVVGALVAYGAAVDLTKGGGIGMPAYASPNAVIVSELNFDSTNIPGNSAVTLMKIPKGLVNGVFIKVTKNRTYLADTNTSGAMLLTIGSQYATNTWDTGLLATSTINGVSYSNCVAFPTGGSFIVTTTTVTGTNLTLKAGVSVIPFD